MGAERESRSSDAAHSAQRVPVSSRPRKSNSAAITHRGRGAVPHPCATMNDMTSWLHTTRRRVKEGILQAVGAHKPSENAEFDERIREFNNHVTEIQRIQEALQIWSDAVDTMCAANVILADAFNRHFEVSMEEGGNEAMRIQGQYRDVAGAFKMIEHEINDVLRPSIHDIFHDRCMQPTESISALVPAINDQINMRKKILLDFDSYNSKIQYEASLGRDPKSKTKQKLDDTTQKLAFLQTNIEAALDEFKYAKPNMLGNELASAIACMYYFNSSASVSMAKLLPFLPETASTLCLLCLQTSKKALPGAAPPGDSARKLAGTSSLSAAAAQAFLGGGKSSVAPASSLSHKPPPAIPAPAPALAPAMKPSEDLLDFN